MTLQEIRMKLVAPFETSMERTEARRILLVQADVDGVTGWGECVAVNRRIQPGNDRYGVAGPARLSLADGQGQGVRLRRGSLEPAQTCPRPQHGKASLETAVWDAEAKQKGIPLAKLIGGVREEIASGVSIGIKESLDELATAVQKELAAGYQRIKIKIKPGRTLSKYAACGQDFAGAQLDRGACLLLPYECTRPGRSGVPVFSALKWCIDRPASGLLDHHSRSLRVA